VPSPEDNVDPLHRGELPSLRGPGDQELNEELAGLFVEDVPPRLEALQGAIGGGDAASVEQAAHALKGNSGNVGVLRMSTVCYGLGAVGRSGKLEDAAALVERLKAGFGGVRSSLEADTGRSRG
jgi:HPt (histidine-containing phosphotransfer) domain-containing protein